VITPARARGAPSVRLWQSRGVATPEWPVVAECSRRWSPSAPWSSRRPPGNDRLGSALGRGTGAAQSAHNAGMSAPLGGGDVRATGCKCCHPRVRHSESLSCGQHIISSTAVTHEPSSLWLLGEWPYVNPRCDLLTAMGLILQGEWRRSTSLLRDEVPHG